eukprot:486312-Prymnesium_polylepis.1
MYPYDASRLLCSAGASAEELCAARVDFSPCMTVGSDPGSTWVPEHAGAPTSPSRPCRTSG